MTQRSNERRPRVAMVVAGDVFGGAERQLLTLCLAGRDDFTSTVVTTLPGPLAGAATASGTAVLGLRADAGGVTQCATHLAGALASGAYDLVHTHGYRASVITALAMARAGRLPAVRTVHGAPEAVKAPKMAIYEILGKWADWYTRAHRVYVSHELAGRLGAGNPGSVIHNGVASPTAPGPRPAPYADGHFNIVVVGRLEPVKGLKHLLAAIADRDIGDTTVLHLVGDGPLRGELEAQARLMGIDARVLFHGFRNDALDFIAHADALALPSLHEGVPYVLLEALALGTPVVASRVGGIPEVVRDGQEGLLVASGSASELVRALTHLRSDRALVERFRTAGQLRVTQEFSASVMARRYAHLYRSLLSGCGKGV